MTLTLHEKIHEWKKAHPECELCDEPTLTVSAVDYIDEDGQPAVRLAGYCRRHSATLSATCPRCGRRRGVFRRDGDGELICETCREGDGGRTTPTSPSEESPPSAGPLSRHTPGGIG